MQNTVANCTTCADTGVGVDRALPTLVFTLSEIVLFLIKSALGRIMSEHPSLVLNADRMAPDWDFLIVSHNHGSWVFE